MGSLAKANDPARRDATKGPERLTPEVGALLACARVAVESSEVREMQNALAACPAVESLCETAVMHRMLGHLHQAVTEYCGAEADSELFKCLSELQRAAAHRSLRQTSQLLRVLNALEAAKIAAVPFKGPVWAQVLYGDVTLRNSVDLDLLVDEPQAIVARRALLDEGFVDGNPFNEKMLLGRQRVAGQIALREPASSLLLDLHWKMNVALGRRSLEYGPISSRTVGIDLLGREVVSPGRLDMFLITCLEGTRDRWSTVGRVLDAAVQILRMSPEDWASLLELASLYGIRRRVLVAVEYVCRVMGLETPASVGAEVSSDRISRALVRSLQSSALAERRPDGLWERIVLLFWTSATEDRTSDRVSQAVTRLLLPTPEDWSALPLPRWLDWLYYPLRPARLIVKWAGRLVGLPHMKRRIQSRRKQKGL